MTRSAFGIVHSATGCQSHKAKKKRSKAGSQDRTQSQSFPRIKRGQGETKDKESSRGQKTAMEYHRELSEHCPLVPRRLEQAANAASDLENPRFSRFYPRCEVGFSPVLGALGKPPTGPSRSPFPPSSSSSLTPRSTQPTGLSISKKLQSFRVYGRAGGRVVRRVV